jgi:hypothetical protein
MPGPSPFHASVVRWRKRYSASYETCQLETLQPDPQGGPSQLVMCHAPTHKGARHCADCAKRLLTKYDAAIPLRQDVGR